MTSTVTAVPAAEERRGPDGASRPASLWGNRDFLKFWSGETLSLFGTQVTTLAIPLTAVLVFKATPAQVGLLRFLQLVPYLGLAMVFGVWVDRGRRKPVMMLANGARMVLIASIPVLSATHRLTLGLLLGIACAVGVFSVLFDVSWMAFVPTLVKEPEHYVEANQKLGVTSSSADVAGPGVAGAVISALSAPTALALDGVSYLISLLTLLWIRTPEPRPAAPAQQAERHLTAELRQGLRFVFGDRILRPLALIAPFCNFSMVGVWTMFLLYATRGAGLSPAQVGIVFAASSVGGLIGAALSRRLIARFRLGALYAVSMIAVFVAPLLIPLASGPRPVLLTAFIASFFLAYLGLGVANVVVISLRQASTPQPLMGRMNAAFRTVLFGGGALGGLAGGLIAGAMGPRAGLAAVAAGSALMVLPVLLSPVTRLPAMPAMPADPEGRE
ncbi:MFS transporter [Catenulispora sp. NF23]|uniref:MFS transporter n=1 Tax=Catenulispora pinistramenti TaxID=2705254 RepID=UPI001BADF93E|nr:MFS transporter [Catenulispora pinistramenti]MBS2539471.1 MFS transporter [Catenulispora pinistramenti]